MKQIKESVAASVAGNTTYSTAFFINHILYQQTAAQTKSHPADGEPMNSDTGMRKTQTKR